MPPFPPAARPRRASASLVPALVLVLAVALPEAARAAAVAVGTNGVSLTSSSVGLTWNAPVTIDGAVSFAGVWFSTPTNGIAVGNGNAIFRSVNGGGNWSPISSPITTTYNDVMFPSETTGYIACTSGQVLKSTNSGASWTAQSTAAPGGLLGIHFVSATQGCAVGIAGAIVRTTNGGTNWTNESTGSADLADVFFFDASNGWAVGTGGTILRSTNGGDTWNAVTSGTTVDLAAVWFTSATLGFVCGGDRVVRRTTNGGTSWSAVTLPATGQQSGLFDLMFADPDTGIVVGSGVNAYRTTNGGTTWEVANPDPTNEVLQAVHLARPPGPTPQVSVTVSALPAGRSFSVDGTTFTSPQSFLWDSGSTHTLAVTTPQSVSAGERYAFTAWSGGSTSTSTSISVSPTTDAAFTANFQRQFLLTMPSVTGGTTTPGTTWHNAGAVVPIFGDDATGYDFVSWSGSGSGSYTGTNNPASVTMNGAITETADFDPVAITLTFQTSPTGRSIIVDGTTRTAPYVLTTTADVSHTLDVPSPQGEAGGTRFAFLSWSDGGAKAHTIDPLVSGTYTATLKTQYFLDMAVSPGIGGTAVPGDTWHDAASRVNLSVTPSVGYFAYFHDGTGTGSYDGFPGGGAAATMNGPLTQTVLVSNATPRSVTVQASPPGPDLTAAGVDIGTAKTFSWPNGLALPIGAPVTQDAIANVKRWQWTSWSDAGARNHTVTPTSTAPRYTANFDVQFELRMSAETGGTTTPPPGDSWVDSNTVVQITALPDANHEFQSWSGTGSSAYSGSNNPASFTIRGVVAELARFDLLPRLTLPDLTTEERRFVAGEPETIRWSANYASTQVNVMVEYKHTIASTWLLIGSARPQDEQVAWTPPDDPQSNLQMRIRSTSPNVIGDTLSGTFQICDPYFNPGPAITSLAADSAPLDVVPLDFDGDGILDLAYATATGVTFRTGLAGGTPGVGSGGFGPPTTLALATGAKRLAVGDIDSDGDLDILVAPRTGIDSFIRLRRGTDGAQGAYAVNGTLNYCGGTYGDFALADVTEDGILDVVAVTAAATVCVVKGSGTNGNGDGFWIAGPATFTEASPRRMRVADLNRDGLLDVVLIAGPPHRLTVHFGSQGSAPGQGQFGPAHSLTLPEEPGDLVLADFDEDGLLDAAWSAPLDSRIFVVPKVGAGGPGGLVFGATDTVATGGFFTRLAVADFDRDGHADLAAVDAIADVTTIHRGRGDGTLEFLLQRSAGTAASHATVQDFLEDGRTDLLLTDADGTTKLFAADFASCSPVGNTAFLDEPDAAGIVTVVGAELTVRWRPFGSTVAADLDVTHDNGATWQAIARGIVTRSFSWTVTPPATTTARIRVRSSTGNGGGDQSANPLTILAPTVGVPSAPAIPAVAAFAAPIPNPGRGAMRFRLDLPAAADARVVLYDVSGRRIRTLVAGELPAGSHAVAWDGRDDGGRTVGAGVYLARARWEGFAQERRIVRLGD